MSLRDAIWSLARNLPRRIGSITLWQLTKDLTIAVAGAVLFLVLALLAVSVWPNHQVPLNEPVTDIVYLDQGWGPGRESPSRQAYYYAPQGTSLKTLRYSWLVHLERPWSTKRLADPDHMQSYGFIVDLAPTPANPHQLPVGFAHHFDNELQDEVLDITCAACHTGQLSTWKDGKRVAIRVDGGQAMHAFTDMNPGDFVPDLLLAMTATYINPFKFNRFARNVLRPEHYASGKSALRSAFGDVLKTFLKQGWNDKTRHLYPVAEGYGRTDAIGRIANTVFGDHISAANYRPGNTPVNYPPVWDIWRFDWVQYGASVRHPLARNVGEGMGVGTTYHLVDQFGRPIPASERYQASTMIEDLYQIEKTLWYLEPPRWPDALLGKIDCQRAIYGKTLFRQYCVRCHGPRLSDAATLAIDAPCKTRDTRWIMAVLKATDIGTDPTAAENFAGREVDLTPTGLTAVDVRRLREPLMREDANRRLALLQPGSDQYRHFGEIDSPQAPPSYKARPLAGIWATPPFLHNGSVPNLYQLLSPAEKRDAKFLVGTREFDARNVGYVLRPLTERGFVFDTSIPGNSNRGHEFRGTAGNKAQPPTSAACASSEDTRPAEAKKIQPPKDGVLGPELNDQRWAIIEYLKIHRDDPAAGEFPDYCYCKGTAQQKEPEVKIPKCGAGG